MPSQPIPPPAEKLTKQDRLEVKKFPTKQDGVPLVGLWGMPKSGKTSFMAALYWDLMHSDTHRNWEMVPCNTASHLWAHERMRDLWYHGIFPPETARGTNQVYTFDLKPRDTSKDTWRHNLRFTFLDAAGEDLRMSLGLKNPDGSGDTVVDYLGRCDAVIVLLDPLLGREADFGQLTSMLHALYERNANQKLQKTLLFVVAKCDVIPFRNALTSSETASQLLANQLPHLPNIISGYVETPIIYATSSIGFEDGRPQNIFRRYDGLIGIREPQKVRPRNVVEAFDELAKRLHR